MPNFLLTKTKALLLKYTVIFFYELECLYEEPRHVATDSKLMGDSDRERYVTQALNLGLLTFGSMINVYDQQDFRI